MALEIRSKERISNAVFFVVLQVLNVKKKYVNITP